MGLIRIPRYTIQTKSMFMDYAAYLLADKAPYLLLVKRFMSTEAL